MEPLTHHQILELIGPLCRGGRHVDLPATDRLQRRIVFKLIDHAETAAHPGLRETLVLEEGGAGSHRLTRILAPAADPAPALAARLEVEGSDLSEMLVRIEAVPPHRQFRQMDGAAIAVSFRLPRTSTDAALIFIRGAACVAGMLLTLEAPGVAGAAVPVRLVPDRGAAPRLPQDALAVLGGRWSRLRESGDGWAGELRLRGREPQRSRHAEASLDRAARHLALMLKERPARFHERWSAARWRVFFRRLVPLAGCIGLIACAAAVPKLHLAEGSGLRMLILNSPPLLMILFFCLREIPIVEIPPLPRRSDASSWCAGAEPHP